MSGRFWLLAACAGCAGQPTAPPAPPAARPLASSAAGAPSTPPSATGQGATKATEAAPRFEVAVVATGPNHACAVGKAGAVLCWGENGARQLGSDCGATCPTPTRVPLEEPALALALTASASCALLRDRSVACWGDHKPVSRVGSSPAARLVSGAPGSCVLDAQGALSCAGNNHLGRLGFPAAVTDPPWIQRQARVTVPEPVGDAFIAYQFGCAATTAHSLFCWGSPLDCAGPVKVELAGKVQRLAGGEGYLCLLTQDGKVFAASEYRESAQSGCQDFPFVFEGPLATGARAVSCHASPQSGCSDCSGCVVREDRGVACWRGGTDGQGRLPALEPVAGITGATEVSVGRGFACALTGSGKLWCWGDNRLGQLGRGTTTSETTPAEPAFP